MKRMLVAVDDREPSETLVSLLAALARAGTTIRLVRVLAVPEMVVDEHGPTGSRADRDIARLEAVAVLPLPGSVAGTAGRTVAYVDQEMARLEARASMELARVVALGIEAEPVVRFGDPVKEILLEAEAFEADVIALAGRQQGRLQATLRPDVADAVARRAGIPALVLREP
jgi:nucleotide-binding universal stress UspA family protein